MDDKALQLIDVLGKTHSISRAADKIYISQSTISKRIKQIEQELGFNIILRSRQGVHFTPEGEIVLEYKTEIKTANSHAFFAALLENEFDIAILRGEYQWSEKNFF